VLPHAGDRRRFFSGFQSITLPAFRRVLQTSGVFEPVFTRRHAAVNKVMPEPH